MRSAFFRARRDAVASLAASKASRVAADRRRNVSDTRRAVTGGTAWVQASAASPATRRQEPTSSRRRTSAPSRRKTVSCAETSDTVAKGLANLPLSTWSGIHWPASYKFTQQASGASAAAKTPASTSFSATARSSRGSGAVAAFSTRFAFA